jgi:transmembrane sensor
MSYADYTLEDFVMDDSFRAWVKNPSPQQDRFWTNWLEQHPEKKEVIEKARVLIRAIEFEQEGLSDSDSQLIWSQIQSRAREQGDPIPDHTIRPAATKIQWQTWYRVAAVFTGLVLLAALGWLLIPQDEQAVVTTAYGKTTTVTLPDHSVVTLNGNSELRYAQEWSQDQPREVWLKGEAYFKVSKGRPAAGNAKFRVHASEVQVEVLGTEFNVSDRHQSTQVVLSEGKIRLSLQTDTTHLMMKPGELVEFLKKSRKLDRKQVDPEVYAAWRKRKLIFDNAPLHQIATMIDDTYGLKIIFEDSLIANQRFAGKMNTTNVDTLLITLAKASNSVLERQGKTVNFKSRKPSQ